MQREKTRKQSISFTIFIARNNASRHCQLAIANCRLFKRDGHATIGNSQSNRQYR